MPERTLSVCGKKGDILPLMFIRMLFFLLVSFWNRTYRSGKSRGNVYVAMDASLRVRIKAQYDFYLYAYAS